MGTNLFEVSFADETVDAIRMLPCGISVPLLSAERLEGPVSGINTWANVMYVPEGFDLLHLSSQVDLTYSKHDIQEVAQDVADWLKISFIDEDITTLHGSTGLGVVVLHDTLQKDVTSILTPFLGGRKWHVGSSFNDFGNYEQLDIDSLERLLQQHTGLLSSLVRVVFDSCTSEQDTGKHPRVFELSVPKYARNSLELKDENDIRQEDAFSAFVGIDWALEELRNMVRAANTPASVLATHGVEITQACIFYGPSGLGKSELMNALASALNADTVHVSLGSLAASYIGEWAKNIDNIFEEAYKKDGRTLLIFDEIDGLIKNGNADSTGNVTTVMKEQLERLKQFPHVFFAASTNHIDKLDPAILADKRIPLKIPLSLPNEEQRTALFVRLLHGSKLAAMSLDDVDALVSLDAVNYDFLQLAQETDELSPGDIKAIIQRVNARKLFDNLNQLIAPDPPTQQEIRDAIQRARFTRPH